MLFVLLKLLINFIYPFTWIIILFLVALITKNRIIKQRASLISVILLLIFTNPFLINAFAGYWDIQTKENGQKYNCAIILGGFVSEDLESNGYFNNASDRFIQALKLKHSGKANHLLFTGGNADIRPSGFRESAWLGSEVSHYNIADSSVLIEANSRNTLENANLSKALLKNKKLNPPYLLVTSAFHMRRSLLTFKKAGLDVQPYSCNYIAGRDKTTLNSFIPAAHVLPLWNTYIKEVVGIIVYSFK